MDQGRLLATNASVGRNTSRHLVEGPRVHARHNGYVAMWAMRVPRGLQ
jgi:hypothetical protein